MPYLDRQNRTCGFLDIEENETSDKFVRRYFILDTQKNFLQWYMDNPQNLPVGTESVGSLRLSYISKVTEASVKQKPKAEFCFIINALSRRYFLKANDAEDLKNWVVALNNATKITVPKITSVDADNPSAGQSASRQAYKTEIVGGVVVHTPVQQIEADDVFVADTSHVTLRRCPAARPNHVRSGYCVKQGNVRKSWKRRFFVLDHQSVSYYKSETVRRGRCRDQQNPAIALPLLQEKEPLRSVRLRDVLKVSECLVKSGDLLSRDNLFEIITSTRTFYIQADTPEDMRGWINDIALKINDFRGSSKGRGSSRALQKKPQLFKSCSITDSWQPWTPVPSPEAPYSSLPSLTHPGHASQTPPRQRHHSQPQLAPPDTNFSDRLSALRTTDV